MKTRKVDVAADSVVYSKLFEARQGRPCRGLGARVDRKDHGFHAFRQAEVVVAVARDLGDSPLAYVLLAGLARFLAAHSPTPRSVKQTVDNAIKLLQRGGALYG